MRACCAWSKALLLSWVAGSLQVTGGFVMWCPARAAAEHLASQGHDVYVCDFVHEPVESVNWPSGTRGFGAFHGAEVPSIDHMLANVCWEQTIRQRRHTDASVSLVCLRCAGLVRRARCGLVGKIFNKSCVLF